MELEKYRPYWTKDFLMGPNSLRILQELLERNPCSLGGDSLILDLGCGTGLTSFAMCAETGAEGGPHVGPPFCEKTPRNLQNSGAVFLFIRCMYQKCPPLEWPPPKLRDLSSSSSSSFFLTFSVIVL